MSPENVEIKVSTLPKLTPISDLFKKTFEIYKKRFLIILTIVLIDILVTAVLGFLFVPLLGFLIGFFQNPFIVICLRHNLRNCRKSINRQITGPDF